MAATLARGTHGDTSAELSAFIGREQELGELRELARASRALTLCGAAGIGKTRLALRLIGELAPGYADGAWFVELADLRQPDLVVARIATVLGVAEEPGRPLLATLADALRPRQALIGLDNCEHLVDACARVCHQLLASSAGLRMITTSREPLRVAAETIWQVPPLSLPRSGPDPGAHRADPPGALGPGTPRADMLGPPRADALGSDALRLFADRAAAVQPGFVLAPANLIPVSAICRALDGLPLAIELAAAWVRALTVDQIQARLADRFRLLSSAERTAPPRHRTLRAAVDWSHDLLTPAEKILLRRLAVFADWSLDMAEQVCAGPAPGDGGRDTPSALARRGTLLAGDPAIRGRPGPGWPRAPGPREPPAALARGGDPPEPPAALARGGDPPEPPAALARQDVLDLHISLADKSLIIAEHDQRGRGDTRYRMLDTIREYASERLAEAGERDLLHARFRDYAVREVERLALVGMAQAVATWPERVDAIHRFETEQANLRQILGRCLAAGDAELGLRICMAMRPVWIVQGSFAEGTGWIDAFLAVDLSGVPGPVLGAGLITRAQLALAPDPARAREHALAGLELCRSAGSEFWASSALNLLAEAALHAGQLAEAIARADEALELARGSGDRWNEGYASGTRAAAAAAELDLAGARRLAESAHEIMREIDQQWGLARALLGLGDLARLDDDPHGARQRYQQALVILREVSARPEIARCLAGLGRLAISQGELSLARKHLTESVELSQSSGSRIGVIRAIEAFITLAVAEDDPVLAVRLTAAVAAMRRAAKLPAAPAGRVQRGLDAAARLGDEVIGELWAEGSALDGDAAVALAVSKWRGPGPGAGRPAGDAHGHAAGLTPRELEIVGLISRGLSNRAIAEALFISQATAARHVANVMAKLGFTSRVQIAAWALDQPGPPAVRLPAGRTTR